MSARRRKVDTAHVDKNGAAIQASHQSAADESNDTDCETDTGTDRSSIALDVVRVLLGLVFLSCVLSWLITKDSLSWGYRPWFTQPSIVKAWWVSQMS